MSTTTSARRTSSSALAALAAALLAVGARAEVLDVPADFPTVAAALAAAVEGDVIVLAAGSYNDPVVVDSKTGITLRGKGKVVLAGGTALTPALSVTSCHFVTIERLRIVPTLGNGVFVAGSNDITLSRLVVEGAGDDAIVGGESGPILVDRCRIEGGAGDGIAWFEAGQITVSRCIVNDVLGHGIRFDDCGQSVADRCRVTGVSLDGITIGQGDTSTACTAVRNVIVAPGVNGITLRGTDNNALENRVTGADGAGVMQHIGTSAGGVIRGNKLVACEEGVLLQGSGVLVQDNRVVKPLVSGVICESEPFVLQDNRVTQSGDDAFLFGDGANSGSVLGCRAVHPGADGFDIGGDGLSFTGNSCVGAAESGFDITGSDNLLVGNTASGGGSVDVFDTGSGNIYLDNDFPDG